MVSKVPQPDRYSHFRILKLDSCDNMVARPWPRPSSACSGPRMGNLRALRSGNMGSCDTITPSVLREDSQKLRSIYLPRPPLYRVAPASPQPSHGQPRHPRHQHPRHRHRPPSRPQTPPLRRSRFVPLRRRRSLAHRVTPQRWTFAKSPGPVFLTTLLGMLLYQRQYGGACSCAKNIILIDERIYQPRIITPCSCPMTVLLTSELYCLT